MRDEFKILVHRSEERAHLINTISKKILSTGNAATFLQAL